MKDVLRGRRESDEMRERIKRKENDKEECKEE